MQAELKVIGGKQQGKIIPLTMKKFLIGREKDCHLRPNNDLISRHHCVFSVDEFTVRLRDLGSTNGTYVNSERIQGQIVLKHGDQLSIGKLMFEISIRDIEAAPVVKSTPEDAALLDTDAFTSRTTPPPQTVNTEMETTFTDVSASETISLPVQTVDTEDHPSGVYGGDTVSIPSSAPADGSGQQPPVGSMPSMPMQQVPGQYYTQGMPQQFPQQMPMYPQQMPMYPQQYPQYFPQQMPMMPQPVQMGQQPYVGEMPGMMQHPPQNPPPQPAAPQEPVNEGTDLDVRLPLPEETGLKEAHQNLGSTGSPQQTDPKAGTVIDPRTAAADIIRQYTHRPMSQ